MRSWFLIAVALAACSKHQHKKTGRSLAIGMLAREPVAKSPPWPIDPPALLARLQGAWVIRDEQELGSIVAWDVHGDRVTIWDARTQQEETATLVFDAPCEYQLHFERGYTTGRFVFDGTNLHLGLGDAGVKLGDQIIACTEIGGVIVSGTSCVFHYQAYGAWMEGSARCTLSGDSLTIKVPRADYDPELTIHGNVLADDQLWDTMPLRVSSYADAKSKAKALVSL